MPRRKKAALQEKRHDEAPVTVTLSGDDWKMLRLALSVWLWTYDGSTDPTLARMALRVRTVRDNLEKWRPGGIL